MDYLMILSITTGVLCFGWAAIAPSIGLLIWVGFAGCTSYFAAGGKTEGLKKSMIANIAGMIIAIISIRLMGIWDNTLISAIITGIGTFIMCIQGKFKLLSFIPGTFVGSYCTFAAGGSYVVVLASLLVGGLLGCCCEQSAVIVAKKLNIENNIEN